MIARRLLLAQLLCLSMLACGDESDDDEGPIAVEAVPVARRAAIPLHKGFVGGKPAEYYSFGRFVPDDADWFPSYDNFPGMPVAQIYVFTDEVGNVAFPAADDAQMQRPIIDKLPLQADYSDFLEVIQVYAPAGYVANEVKSRGTLLRRGFDLRATQRVVNCPVVGADATLQAPAKVRAQFRRVRLWQRKRTTFCWLFDGGGQRVGGSQIPLLAGGAAALRVFSVPVGDRIELRVAASEFYTLVAAAYGGEDRVTGIAVPNNGIYRYAPDSDEYSPLGREFEVTVPSDYRLGQLTSYEDLFPVPDFTDPRIEAVAPDAFHNGPLVWVEP